MNLPRAAIKRNNDNRRPILQRIARRERAFDYAKWRKKKKISSLVSIAPRLAARESASARFERNRENRGTEFRFEERIVLSSS